MESLVFLVLSLMSAGAAEGGSWVDAAGGCVLGPVPPRVDLRNMLTEHVVRRSCGLLEAAARKRERALRQGDWRSWRETVREAVRKGLGPVPFGDEGCDLNVRLVSRHERPGYKLENVLFESLPGLDVNASVYLPIESIHPPPWPAVVVPVGHSAKTMKNYQEPAQVFARMGYVALTFDPPGMAGEKPVGNDHFNDGVRCYLTGHSSNRYFVIDALRCIDYLGTRPDVDLGNGVGMTGVSGGGTTTMFATLLDDRIKAAGLSCCAVPNALHPVLDGYAPCPETLAFGRFALYDDTDLLVAAMPTPVLLMAGAADEVFTEPMSRQVAAQVKASFEMGGFGDRFSFFLDPGGHAYSVAMAVKFVAWMDKWIRHEPGWPLPDIAGDELEVLSPEMLACHPRQEQNMFSVNRDVAVALRTGRSGLSVSDAARMVAGVAGPTVVPEASTGDAARVWFHYVQEVLLEPGRGIELPATFLYPAEPGRHGAALLYFDERGRWTDLRSHGPLAHMARFLQEGAGGPAVLTVDLRGWGDTRPADTRYDMAGWGSRDRWLSYVSAAMGDHVLAMRIRDGLSVLAYVRSREEIDPQRVVVGGHGMGGVVALHVAAIDGAVAGVFCTKGLASFESLATAESYLWSHDCFLPNVLEHYDLPELVADLDMPALVANPLGPMKQPLTREEAQALYRLAVERGGAFRLRIDGPDEAVRQFVHEVLGQ